MIGKIGDDKIVGNKLFVGLLFSIVGFDFRQFLIVGGIVPCGLQERGCHNANAYRQWLGGMIRENADGHQECDPCYHMQGT